MYSGPAPILDDHRAIFDAIAGNVFDVGREAGMGQAMKLLNNVLSATALAATSEAVAFGVAQGLDMAQIIDVLNVSTGRNSATDDKFPNRVLSASYDSGFHTRLMTKDVDLFVSEAVTAGTSAEVIGAVLDVWRAADRAMPDSDFTEIWKFVSRVGEVDVAEKVQRGRRRAQLSQG
jgi:3-hydroxyisobutyrate dehydrogenase-like beta-hydroxyacid dehydrogenase